MDSRLAEVEEKYDLNSAAMLEGFSEEDEDGNDYDDDDEEDGDTEYGEGKRSGWRAGSSDDFDDLDGKYYMKNKFD